jgi:hypothetical protein
VSTELDYDIQTLLTPASGPCISIYLPVHGSFPASKQDEPRYRILLGLAREQLLEHHDAQAVERLLAPAEALIGDENFWDHTFSGLAVFIAPEMFRVVRLQAEVTERAVVADTFYIKPLIEHLQGADRFMLLAISRHSVRLLAGHQHYLTEVPLHPSIPRSAVDVPALSPESDVRTQAAAGGEQRGQETTSHHGGGSKRDVVNQDEERFFRAVAAGVREHHVQGNVPVLLAATPDHQATFRKVAKGLKLLDECIDLHVGNMADDRLAELAWEAVQPRYERYVRSRVDEYRESLAKRLASDNPVEVTSAASEGRVGVLLVERDRRAHGQTEGEETLTEPSGPQHREVDTLLNDIALLALQTAGEVIVLPPEAMPSGTGLAAIYRYDIATTDESTS